MSESISNLLDTTVGKRKISDRVIKGVKNTVGNTIRILL